eukprot:4890132-Karenia_brevis.AAC.1
MLDVNVSQQILGENVGAPRKLDNNFNVNVSKQFLGEKKILERSAWEIGRQFQSGVPILDAN